MIAPQNLSLKLISVIYTLDYADCYQKTIHRLPSAHFNEQEFYIDKDRVAAKT